MVKKTFSRRTESPRPLADILEARFARQVCARLNADHEALPADISERLRVARQQALSQAQARRATLNSLSTVSAGVAALHKAGHSPRTQALWQMLVALLPLLVLVAGLTLIQKRHVQAQITTAAEIDMALLADDLPPDAYSDEGFVEFLKVPALQ